MKKWKDDGKRKTEEPKPERSTKTEPEKKERSREELRDEVDKRREELSNRNNGTIYDENRAIGIVRKIVKAKNPDDALREHIGELTKREATELFVGYRIAKHNAAITMMDAAEMFVDQAERLDPYMKKRKRK